MKIISFIYNLYLGYLLHTDIGRKKAVYYLSTRKERTEPNCLDCGACCCHCYAYDKDNHKCLIWKEAKRVFHCDMFPIAPLALTVFGVKDKCRYYWS